MDNSDPSEVPVPNRRLVAIVSPSNGKYEKFGAKTSYRAIYFSEFHGYEFSGYDFYETTRCHMQQDHNLILGSRHLEDGEWKRKADLRKIHYDHRRSNWLVQDRVQDTQPVTQ